MQAKPVKRTPGAAVSMHAPAQKAKPMPLPPRPVLAAIAAHRFGLGEASLEVVGADAPGWLEAQIGPADAARGEGRLDTRGGLELSPPSARSARPRAPRRRA